VPGLRKQPDSSWGPHPRPQPARPNSPVVTIIRQSNGDIYPTLVLEVGNSQRLPDLLQIRDRCLGWQTGINVFVIISYNRNLSRQTDSWYMQVAHRDFTAPQPPAGFPDTHTPCIVLFETAKANNRYPRVNASITAPNDVCEVPTDYLFLPEPRPNTTPAHPDHFIINVEEIRKTIQRERRA
jgi:hypothetical protein